MKSSSRFLLFSQLRFSKNHSNQIIMFMNIIKNFWLLCICYLIISFRAFPALNFGDLDAAISMVSPV